MSCGPQPAMICQPLPSGLLVPSQTAGCGMTEASHQSLLRRNPSKSEICDLFLQRLRDRGTVELTPSLIEGIRLHFQLLPSRYAKDVNVSSLDILNHKRLLESARADPSAVSFQVRPVDVAVLPPGGNERRMPSFGGLDVLLTEVRHGLFPELSSSVESCQFLTCRGGVLFNASTPFADLVGWCPAGCLGAGPGPL